MAHKSIYLAGKISKHDWRESIVGSGINEGADNGSYGCAYGEGDSPLEGKILKKAVFGMDYTGPFFFACDHGCYHGEDSHGVDANGVNLSPAKHLNGLTCMKFARERTSRICLQQIKSADIVFAWIADLTCYGTIAEIGYAKALGKIIWIAGPHYYHDIWFAYEMANETLFEYWMNPKLALQMFLAKEEYRTKEISYTQA